MKCSEGDRRALAAGLPNTSQQIGGAIGVAIASTVAATHFKTLSHSGATTPAALTGGFQWALRVCGAIGLVAVPVTFLLIRRRDPAPSAGPALVSADGALRRPMLRRQDPEMDRTSPSCSHLDAVTVTEVPAEIAGCEACLVSGGWWVHLRMCQSCGRIGCCDSSPNRHASAHAREAGHPIVRSAEAGEGWSYCYVDDLAFVLTGP